MIFPDGSIKDVDSADVATARTLGAKEYSEPSKNGKKVSMQFSDGSIKEVDSADLAVAESLGAVKKKENGISSIGLAGAQVPPDFMQEYTPQVSRDSNADIPYLNKAKSTVLDLAKQQAAQYPLPGFPKVILGDQPTINNGDDVKGVEEGDPEAIKRVIQRQISIIDAEKDNIPKSDIPKEYAIIDEKLKELNYTKNTIIGDGLNLIGSNLIKNEWDKSEDKSIERQREIGSKYRQAIIDMQAKNPDGTIDNYSDQKRQVEFLLKNKIDKSFGWDRVSNTPELQEQYKQEFDFSNQSAFLSLKASKEAEDFNEYLKNKEVAKFVSPKTTDLEREQLLASPVVKNFLEDAKKLKQSVNDINNLPSLYPKVNQQIQAEKVFQAYGDYIANRRKTVAGEVIQNAADIFSGYQLDEEKEFKAVSDITGIPVDEVKQVVKENPDAAYVPSHLRKVINSAAGMLNGIEQSFYRGVLSKPEADIVNREIGKEVLKTPSAFNLMGPNNDINVSIRSVMDGVSNGLGQFLGFAGTMEMGGEVLAIPKSAGLFSEARFLSKAGGLPVSEYSTEAGRLINALDRAKTVASTYGVGYAASYESAYRDAARFTNNEADRQNYANQDAFWNGASELLIPDAALAKQLGKSGTNKVLAALKSGKPLTTIEALALRIGEGAKVMGLESAEEVIPLVYETLAKDNMFGYKTSREDFMKQLYQTVVTTAVSTVPMALGAGLRSPTSTFTKAALYNAGINSEIFKGLITDKVKTGAVSQDEANKQIKMVNTMAVVVSETDQIAKDGGFENDTEKKIEIAAQLLRKRVNGSASESINNAISKRLYEEDDKSADEAIQAELNKNKIFTDFDGTLFHDGKLTTLGDEMKAKIASGEDVTVLTARDATKENIDLISQQLGINPNNIQAGLTPEGKANAALPGSTFYDNDPANLAAVSKKGGVNVIDSNKSETSTSAELDPLEIIQKALDDNTIKGSNADQAKVALAENKTDEFLQSVSDQALNKTGDKLFTPESAMNRAKEMYGDEVVKLAIEKFPVEQKAQQFRSDAEIEKLLNPELVDKDGNPITLTRSQELAAREGIPDAINKRSKMSLERSKNTVKMLQELLTCLG